MERSRSVANLTLEQLYRKRAFDRINQRASRARKKSRIDELEKELGELREQLQRSEEKVRRLQHSEAVLREAIDAARFALHKIDSTSPSLNKPFPSPPASTHTTGSGGEDSAVSSTAEDGTTVIPAIGAALHSGPEVAPLARQDLYNFPDISIKDDTASFAVKDDATGLTLDLPLAQDIDSALQYEGFVTDPCSMSPLSLSFLTRFSNQSSGEACISPISNPSSQDVERPWERLPLHIDPTCRLDTVLLEQAKLNRQRLQTCGPIPELSAGNQAFPSISSLLNPEPDSSQAPISNAIGTHGRITMEIPSLPAKIAMMYNMCHLLRWLISPTKQNYEAMPEYLRPLEIQLTTPHPVWIDLIVWPEARERIIKYMDWTQFPTLRSVGNQSISINWPHGQSEIFTAVSEKGIALRPRFENHIRQLQNWTFTSELSDAFPFLKDMTQGCGAQQL
ncbi:uncharacterized protein EI97DRAFT_437300 [Westerdykella ornata]|uniref:BZIP domain-containing protein n=1 Tax=Westerdykella ornata TaxID=318751 RepID=A0A6A6J7N9_WESOR|nr:uncharacterized protein EI97DRAFT_437300 [Westerdykella ornata]KAF2272018.1 hypothetical protein EI97DRAFT_437300 [Westerdykella ornata]